MIRSQGRMYARGQSYDGATREYWLPGTLSPDELFKPRELHSNYKTRKNEGVYGGKTKKKYVSKGSGIEEKAKACIKYIIEHGKMYYSEIVKIYGAGTTGSITVAMSILEPIYEELESKTGIRGSKLYFAIQWDFVRDKEEFIRRYV